MCKKKLFRCYVDESGDPCCRGSEYFFLSAVIVADENTNNLRGIIDKATNNIWISKNKTPPAGGIHWKNLDYGKKYHLSKLYQQEDFCVVNIWMLKRLLTHPDKICENDSFYHYAIRFIMERISWYVDDRNGSAKIMFSSQTSLRKESLISYVKTCLASPTCQIRHVFDPDKIEIKNMQDEKMLRVADNCVSSFANAFIKNAYGDYQPTYADCIQEKFYRYKGTKLWKYGIKIFPDEIKMENIVEMFPFTENWLK